jgi:hypothetical protein
LPPSRSNSSIRTLLGVCGIALGLSSCARSLVSGGLDTSYNPQDITRDVAFWHRLPERSAITNDEGLHGLLGFVLGDDPAKTYDARVKLAIQKGLLPSGFSEPINATMTKGTLAYGLARYLDVKGGVMMRVSGGSGRYATRELTYLGILPEDSTDNQSISGLDFVGVISKAQDYVSVRGTGFEPLQKDR